MLSMSYMGDHVWLITSRQTEPDLRQKKILLNSDFYSSWWSFLNSQLVDIWVEDSVDESYAWALVWVLVRQFDVDFPEASVEWC